MGFPFTLNGTVWAASDFSTSNYARNLGRFLSDMVTNRYSLFFSTSTTNANFTFGSKVFTIEAGKQFQKGMQVVIGSNEEATKGSSQYGVVTAYSGTSLTVNVTAVDAEAVPSSSWSISIGSAAGSIPGASWTTAIAARTALQLYNDTAGLEFFEDFCGYIPVRNASTSTKEATSNTEYEHSVDLVATGSSGIYLNGNARNSIADPDRPGIAVIEMIAPGDAASIAMNGAHRTGSSGYSSYVNALPPYTFNRFEVAMKLVDGTNNTRGDTLQVVFGLLSYSKATTIGYPTDATDGKSIAVGISGSTSYATINSLGHLLVTDANGKANTYVLGTQRVVSTLALPKNRWLWFSYASSFANATLSISDDDSIKEGKSALAAQLITDTFTAPLSTSTTMFVPFVAVKKLTGNNKMTVAVDYFRFLNKIGR